MKRCGAPSTSLGAGESLKTSGDLRSASPHQTGVQRFERCSNLPYLIHGSRAAVLGFAEVSREYPRNLFRDRKRNQTNESHRTGALAATQRRESTPECKAQRFRALPACRHRKAFRGNPRPPQPLPIVDSCQQFGALSGIGYSMARDAWKLVVRFPVQSPSRL